MVECIFGWGKQHGAMRKTSIARVAADFVLNLIAYNLVRTPKIGKCLSGGTCPLWANRRETNLEDAVPRETGGRIFRSFSAGC
jgi:hypothetical protein